MDPRIEDQLGQTIGPIYEFCVGADGREDAAERRTDRIVKAIEDASRRQAEAIDRLARALERVAVH
jgi:hypothetical protein